MSHFLNSDDLIDLTGYKRGADQARWLKSKGYYVETNARGIPRITWTQVEDIRKLNSHPLLQSKKTGSEPNVVAFRAKLHQLT